MTLGHIVELVLTGLKLVLTGYPLDVRTFRSKSKVEFRKQPATHFSWFHSSLEVNVMEGYVTPWPLWRESRNLWDFIEPSVV